MRKKNGESRNDSPTRAIPSLLRHTHPPHQSPLLPRLPHFPSAPDDRHRPARHRPVLPTPAHPRWLVDHVAPAPLGGSRPYPSRQRRTTNTSAAAPPYAALSVAPVVASSRTVVDVLCGHGARVQRHAATSTVARRVARRLPLLAPWRLAPPQWLLVPHVLSQRAPLPRARH